MVIGIILSLKYFCIEITSGTYNLKQRKCKELFEKNNRIPELSGLPMEK